MDTSVTLELDEPQAKIILRLLRNQSINYAEWRELIGLEEVIVQQLIQEKT